MSTTTETPVSETAALEPESSTSRGRRVVAALVVVVVAIITFTVFAGIAPLPVAFIAAGYALLPLFLAAFGNTFVSFLVSLAIFFPTLGGMAVHSIVSILSPLGVDVESFAEPSMILLAPLTVSAALVGLVLVGPRSRPNDSVVAFVLIAVFASMGSVPVVTAFTTTDRAESGTATETFSTRVAPAVTDSYGDSATVTFVIQGEDGETEAVRVDLDEITFTDDVKPGTVAKTTTTEIESLEMFGREFVKDREITTVTWLLPNDAVGIADRG